MCPLQAIVNFDIDNGHNAGVILRTGFDRIYYLAPKAVEDVEQTVDSGIGDLDLANE